MNITGELSILQQHWFATMAEALEEQWEELLRYCPIYRNRVQLRDGVLGLVIDLDLHMTKGHLSVETFQPLTRDDLRQIAALKVVPRIESLGMGALGEGEGVPCMRLGRLNYGTGPRYQSTIPYPRVDAYTYLSLNDCQYAGEPPVADWIELDETDSVPHRARMFLETNLLFKGTITSPVIYCPKGAEREVVYDTSHLVSVDYTVEPFIPENKQREWLYTTASRYPPHNQRTVLVRDGTIQPLPPIDDPFWQSVDALYCLPETSYMLMITRPSIICLNAETPLPDVLKNMYRLVHQKRGEKDSIDVTHLYYRLPSPKNAKSV